MIEAIILPALGEMKVAEVNHGDVPTARLAEGHAYRANRVLALLSKMMNLAVQPWKLRADSPVLPAPAGPAQLDYQYSRVID